MQIIRANRKAKCAGDMDCENMATVRVHFGKKQVYLCQECVKMLGIECARMVAPRSVKSKFNIVKGRKI